MFKAFIAILSSKSLLVPMVLVFLLGAAYAATIPFHSIIAINNLGMPAGLFGVLVLSTSAVSMIVTILVGVASDHLRDRRSLAGGCLTIGVIGTGLFSLLPSIASFCIVMLIALPVVNAAQSILFASIRSGSQAVAREHSNQINTIARALFSLAWITVPGLAALLVASTSVIDVWKLSCAILMTCLIGFVLFLRSPPDTTPSEASVHLLSSLGTLFSTPVLVRVLSLSCLIAPHRLNGMLLPLLVIEQLGGTAVDIGIVAGVVAALEIPFMLLWGAALKRFSTQAVLFFGSGLFALYMAALWWCESLWQIYALIPLNAAGAAALLSLPITYFQELFPERISTGTAIVSAVSFLGNALAAGAFGIGASVLGYATTPAIGVALFGAGWAATWLWQSDRSGRTAPN